MLKITGWSLLLGAAALIAGLILFYAPPAGDQRSPPLVWNASTGKVVADTTKLVDGKLQIVLNTLGTGVVTLNTKPFAAQDYPFVHIALEEYSENLGVMLTWPDAHDMTKSHAYPVESKSRSSLWIATAELDGWTGDIGTPSLLFVGQPGESVRIRDFSIFPASPWRQLQALYSDVTAYEPWNRAAMNTYTGVTNVSSFYPVLLAAALFVLSLLAYGTLVVVSRGKVRYNRVTAALIFLASWILLDLIWQYRLMHQVAETYRTFAGLDSRQRQSVGPDAKLFNFVSRVKPQLAAEDSRVFVASSDHYNGMRVAYYLYPHNVYWSLHAPEVPYDEFLRTGDYVALINPSTFQFNRRRNFLFAPDRANLPAELVFSDATGTVVRLK